MRYRVIMKGLDISPTMMPSTMTREDILIALEQPYVFVIAVGPPTRERIWCTRISVSADPVISAYIVSYKKYPTVC